MRRSQVGIGHRVQELAATGHRELGQHETGHDAEAVAQFVGQLPNVFRRSAPGRTAGCPAGRCPGRAGWRRCWRRPVDSDSSATASSRSITIALAPAAACRRMLSDSSPLVAGTYRVAPSALASTARSLSRSNSCGRPVEQTRADLGGQLVEMSHGPFQTVIEASRPGTLATVKELAPVGSSPHDPRSVDRVPPGSGSTAGGLRLIARLDSTWQAADQVGQRSRPVDGERKNRWV